MFFIRESITNSLSSYRKKVNDVLEFVKSNFMRSKLSSYQLGQRYCQCALCGQERTHTWHFLQMVKSQIKVIVGKKNEVIKLDIFFHNRTCLSKFRKLNRLDKWLQVKLQLVLVKAVLSKTTTDQQKSRLLSPQLSHLVFDVYITTYEFEQIITQFSEKEFELTLNDKKTNS